MKANIFITGFSGTGKSVVGREVARRLGWRYVDTDEEIVSASGKPIDAIFQEDGEADFRGLERQHLASLCKGERQVVSTGGGMVTDEQNRRLIEGAGVVVCLEARPETIHSRLSSEGREGRGPVVRPMLADPDPLKRIVALKSERQYSYAQADWTVHTDGLSPSEGADEVMRAWGVLSQRHSANTFSETGDLAAVVRSSSGDYPVWVGWDTLAELGQRVRRVLSPGAAYVIADEGASRHARTAQSSLETAGIPAHIFFVSPGERSKDLTTARHIYDWLAERKAERGHLMLAVGGGVVGDLAGFVAATFLRGLPFGQVPTTLLAMMDAAIGGKTGLDLPVGKNMVGAFHQPQFVLAGVETLGTLPRRELASGWAEAIKHGLILDEGLLRAFEEQRDAVMSLDREVTTDLVRRSVAVKADVVSRDERETLGVRVILNYGHTIGHAIEAATGYAKYLHGEAVSIGMMGAAIISEGLGMLSPAEVERQRSVLEAYDLPVHAEGMDVEVVAEAMTVDKKTVGGSIRWVLLERIGRAVTRSDVAIDLVERTLKALVRPPAEGPRA